MSAMKIEQCLECTQYDSLSSIVAILDSPDRTKALVQWLSSHAGNDNCESRCQKRVSVSIDILNAIRDACQPFLDAKETTSAPVAAIETYDDAFPALTNSTEPKPTKLLVPRKKKSTVSQTKRRIHPASANNESSQTTKVGNLVNLPSEQEPLWLRPGDTSSNKWLSDKSTKVMAATSQQPAVMDLLTPTKPSLNTNTSPASTGTMQDAREYTPMGSLIDVYCTLIERSLVPSTPAELQLLLRLLAIEDVMSSRPKSLVSNKEDLVHVFDSATRCRYFSTQCLDRLSSILYGIGPFLWQELVRCDPFRLQLPWMAEKFETALQTHSTARLDMNIPHTALLTLPFDEKRDSRHNFKTRQEQIMYKNREETRDAFLYQLRAFLNVRGKVVDASQSERAMDQIRQSSRVVVDGIHADNLEWFATFVCDLLLQIGPVPLQETDKDLLKIADKDKLQKLHRRFSSKAPSKDPPKLVTDRLKRDGATSPLTVAQEFFTGYQEFFFLFLVSSDSHRCSVYFKQILIVKLKELLAEVNHRALDRKLTEMRIVAKFVGLLYFSPFWTTSTSPLTPMSFHPFTELSLSGFDFPNVIKESYSKGRLVTIVPWLVELLRMTIWDHQSIKVKEYVETIALLRHLQIALREDKYLKVSPFCKEFLVLCLETLSDDVVGLSKIVTVPLLGLPDTETNGTDILDATTVSLTLVMSNPPNSNIEDLLTRIPKLSTRMTLKNKSPGISRKLRPNVVSPISEKRTYHSLPARDSGVLLNKNDNRIETRLQDSFFHQHSDLRAVCDIVVNQVLSAIPTLLSVRCIRPVLVASPDVDVSTIRKKALHECNDLIRHQLEATLKEALKLLVLSNNSKELIGLATELSISSGILSMERTIDALIKAEEKSYSGLVAMGPEHPRRLFESNAITNKPSNDNATANVSLTRSELLLVACTESLEGLMEVIEMDMKIIQRSMRVAVDAFRLGTANSDFHLPREEILRPFFDVICRVDKDNLLPLLCRLMRTEMDIAQETRNTLLLILELVGLVARIARHGLHHSSRFLGDNLVNVARLVISVADEGECQIQQQLISHLCETKLVTQSSLLKAIDMVQG